MLTLGVSGDEHVHAAPAPLQHLDYLVAGEAAGRCCPDSKDVVTCAEAPILIGGKHTDEINTPQYSVYSGVKLAVNISFSALTFLTVGI